MAAPFVRLDASLYVRMPKLNARSAAALARQLIVALPKGSPEGVKHAARQMRADAEALREAQLVARQAAIEERPTRNVRQVDNEADSLFATLLRRLDDYQALAGHDNPTATSAAALSAALFPSRIAFTTGDVLTQWEATEEWFKVLATEQREATLRALVGGGFIDALRAVHAEYGLVTGTTQPAVEKPAKVELAPRFNALLASLQDLALQLVAVANDPSATEALRTGARSALALIDRQREANARRARAGAEDPPADPADPADEEKQLPTV